MSNDQSPIEKVGGKIWKWILGIISTITAIISFVNLIRGNLDLGVLLFKILLVVNLLLFLLYIIFYTKPASSRSSKRVYPYEKYRKPAMGGIVILFLAVGIVLSKESTQKSIALTVLGTPTKIPLPTATPKDVELVDLSVISDGPTLGLDIKVRNIGNNVAVIKSARINVLNYSSFDFRGCYFGFYLASALDFSATYDFDIRPLDEGQSMEFDVSQVILPNEADRFKITLLPRVNQDLWILSKLSLELLYNETDTSIKSAPSFLYPPILHHGQLNPLNYSTDWDLVMTIFQKNSGTY